MQISERQIGLHFNEQKQAIIRVWSPVAKSVAVRTENDTIPLQSQEQDYWTVTTDKIRPGDHYWLLVDGAEQLPDPASVSQPMGVHGASQALDLSYPWQDGGWQPVPLNDYIIYELHVGTFSAAGNFEGVINHLDHLVSLGINAIDIMPVASFPGERNWGYDGVFPFAVQASYGGPRGLQDLVAACHARGIAVILDVVYNHLGPEGNYLPVFGPYFTDKYSTPWGNAVNYDDRLSHGVRSYVIENALSWFRDFHIDALRLDAVHAIKDFSAQSILQEIRLHTDALMQHTGRQHYLIAESDLNDPRYISPIEANGMGMDAQWVDEFHHALRVSAGEKRVGYYLDFSGIDQLAKSYTGAYVYTGEYSEERERYFGKAATGHPGEQFIVFSQNHDQVGNRMLGERSGTLYSFEMQKLLAGAVFSAPYIPMLFMGEEWGETNPFLYFVSHTDQELIGLVRKGRKEEFAAMHNEGEAPDPQSEDTFTASKLNWLRLEQEPHRSMRSYYQHWIALRKNYPALGKNDRFAVKATAIQEKGLVVVERGLTGSKELVLCLLNFSNEVQTYNVPPGFQLSELLIDSADEKWKGPGTTRQLPPSAKEVILQPTSITVYAAYHD